MGLRLTAAKKVETCPNPMLAFIWRVTVEIKIYVYKKDLQT